MPFDIFATNDMWMVSKRPYWIFEFQVYFKVCINSCKYFQFTNLNFVVLVKQRIWNIDIKHNVNLNMQYLHIGISYYIL
jgi:hypothetical protein